MHIGRILYAYWMHIECVLDAVCMRFACSFDDLYIVYNMCVYKFKQTINLLP